MTVEQTKKKRWLTYLGWLFSAIVFGGAIYVFYSESKRYSFTDVLHHLSALPLTSVLLALAITTIGYLTLTCYDWLGLRYLHKSLSHLKVVLVAFSAFAVGNNIGMGNVAGAAVRYRLYANFGIGAITVGELVVLNILSNWLGFFVTAGTVFTLINPALPPQLHIPLSHARGIGIALLMLPLIYAGIAHYRKRAFSYKGKEIAIPRNRIFAAQVLVGCLDFLFGGAVLYVLLPHGTVSLFPFLGAYMVALAAGIVSHVPGGLGVFETLMLLYLDRLLPGSEVLSVLIAFRAIFFLLPLFIGSVLFFGVEVRQRLSFPSRAAAAER